MMLCQFSFTNFKSYRDETIFDLQAINMAEHENSLLRDNDGATFLPVSVIYGPNGGGKTAVLDALYAFISRIITPINNMTRESLHPMKYYKCPPFAFNDKSPKEPTAFTLFFRQSGFEFRYTLSIYNDEVITESLDRKIIGAKRPAKIFHRERNNIELGASLSKKSVNTNNTNVNAKMPYLSFLAINYDFEIIETAVTWFSECLFTNYSHTAPGVEIALIPELKSLLLDMLCEMDIPISDVEITTKENQDDDEEIIDSVYFIRNIKGQVYKLNVFDESSGTLKLFGLLPRVLFALEDGLLMMVDEIDAGLHPKLLRYIIKLFKNPAINKKNAQLVFTSHDMTTMRSDLFRRDEIWFACRDADGASEIYSLYDIRNPDGSRVKSDAPFYKQYLDGRYGADPYLEEMFKLDWKGVNA